MTRPSDQHRAGVSRWLCTCPGCASYRFRRRKDGRLRRHRAGAPLHVDVAPVKALVDDWYAIGFRSTAIAAALGVTDRTVINIRDGECRRTDREVVDRAYRMTVPAIIAAAPDTAMVPSVGVTRRLQGLSWMGHPIGAHSDLPLPRWVRRYSTVTSGPGRSGLIQAGAHRQARAVYEELSHVEGPSARTRRIAAVRGWQSPFAWDDDTIDDPRVGPYEPALLTREAQREAFIEDVSDLLGAGVPVEEVARRVDPSGPLQLAAVAQRLRRWGRLDLARPFNTAAGAQREGAQRTAPV